MSDQTLIPIQPPHLPLDCQPVYASAHNVTGYPFYNRLDCYLRPEAAKALARAVELAARDNLRFRILDAYRPPEAQYLLWAHTPDPDFVADPRRGSTHGRGVALDLTLIDAQGKPLPMGTEFDEFTPAAHQDYRDLPEEVLGFRKLLRSIMESAGFIMHAPEWWHYNLPDPERFPLIPDGEAVPPMLRPEMRIKADKLRAEHG